MSRKTFMNALRRENHRDIGVFGSGTSVVCREMMSRTGAWFPEAHLDPEKMAALAITAHTILGFDVVMPLFSVCHEAAAMGCDVDWGSPENMPESGAPIFRSPDDIRIPYNLISHGGCAVPIKAISTLKRRLGDSAAVCGKVFGAWTLAYHCFGVENFLILTLDDPNGVNRILEALSEVTLRFAKAQLEAGADCLLLADHATRDLCSPTMYRNYLEPLHSRLVAEIDCPLILHICGNTSDRIDAIARTGMACFHYDTKTGQPSEIRRMAGENMALMGGVSNFKLLNSNPDDIASDSAEARRSGIDIVGPECAIPLSTPLENLMAIN